jgi:hypothetical protein
VETYIEAIYFYIWNCVNVFLKWIWYEKTLNLYFFLVFSYDFDVLDVKNKNKSDFFFILMYF